MAASLRTWRWVGLLGLASLVLSTGCAKGPPRAADPRPPEVVVALPLLRDITEHEEFTGRTEAVMTVEVRSRVTGYLQLAPLSRGNGNGPSGGTPTAGVTVEEGADVKKGDLLFEIDRRPYQAEVDRLEAQVRQIEATVQRLGSDYQRARLLLSSRAISAEEVDRITGSRSEAQASLAAARAALRKANLDLDFTRITAPISGRLSRRHSDPGNLVKADETVLTTIVQLQPIHAYFDIDERTVLRLRRLVHDGKLRSAREQPIHVQLALADQDEFHLSGAIDFVDNRLDPGTGTLRIRVEIDNPRRLLSPGMFVRMRLPVSLPSRSTLVPEEALASDQGKKFLYVVNDKNVVEYRPVQTGPQVGAHRVIRTGLKPQERVIVRGQQRVRPGGEVTPRSIEPATRSVRVPPPGSPPAL